MAHVQRIFPGRITSIHIGPNAGTYCPMTNVVLVNWERIHEVRPHLVASTKIPYGSCPWLQGHSWVMGSYSLLSYSDCIYTEDLGGGTLAYDEDGDSHCIPHFVVNYQDETGTARTTTFTKGLIYRATKELLNYDDSVWVYYFVATHGVDA